LLAERGGAAFDQRGPIKTVNKKPGRGDRVFKIKARSQSIAVLNAAIAIIAVRVIKALAHPTAGVGAWGDIDRGWLLARDCSTDNRTTDDATGNRRANPALGARRRRGDRSERCDRKERNKCLLHVSDSPGDAARLSARGNKWVRFDSSAKLECTLPPRKRTTANQLNLLKDIRLENGFFGPIIP
jgi:hypothetical protein